MKKVLFILVHAISVALGSGILAILPVESAAQKTSSTIETYADRSTLKQYRGNTKNFTYVMGMDSLNDGQGGAFRWDSSSTVTPDDYNFIQANNVAIGRWIRANQNRMQLLQGMLFRSGGMTTLYLDSVTNSNGQILVNLTTNNTSTGTAIFKANIIEISITPMQASAAANARTFGSATISADRKTAVVQLTSSNETTVGLLGLTTLTISPLKNAVAGVLVKITFQGY